MTADERARLRALIDQRRRELCEIPRGRERRPRSRYRKVSEETVAAMRAVYQQLGVARQATAARLAGVGSGNSTWATRALVADGVIRPTGRKVRRSAEFEWVGPTSSIEGQVTTARLIATLAACATANGTREPWSSQGIAAHTRPHSPALAERRDSRYVLPMSRSHSNGGTSMPKKDPTQPLATAATRMARELVEALTAYGRLHGRTQGREIEIALRLHLLEHGLVALDRARADGTLPPSIDPDADAERIRAELEELRTYAYASTPASLLSAVS